MRTMNLKTALKLQQIFHFFRHFFYKKTALIKHKVCDVKMLYKLNLVKNSVVYGPLERQYIRI